MKTFLKYGIAVLFVLSFTVCKEKKPKVSEEFQWEYATPESQGFSPQKLEEAVRVLAKKNTKKLLVIRHDKIVYEWFAEGFEDSVRGHGTASLAKAIVGGLSLLVAMNEGYIKPDDPAWKYIPSWKDDSLKSKITIRHLASHTSGMEDSEISSRERAILAAKGLHHHMDLEGWKGHFWRRDLNPFIMARDSAPIMEAPGNRYGYSNPGIAMLTYAVTSSLRNSPYNDTRTYLREKIYEPIGIREGEYTIGYGRSYEEDGLKLVPSWGGGTFAAHAVAKIGRLMLHKGSWQGKQLINPALVDEVTRYEGTALPGGSSRFETDLVTSEKIPGTSSPATTLGWYCNFDKVWEKIPSDAFCGGGAGNQHLFVVPSLDLIVVRFGGNIFDPSKGENFWLGAEKYLFSPVIDAIE